MPAAAGGGCVDLNFRVLAEGLFPKVATTESSDHRNQRARRSRARAVVKQHRAGLLTPPGRLQEARALLDKHHGTRGGMGRWDKPKHEWLCNQCANRDGTPFRNRPSNSECYRCNRLKGKAYWKDAPHAEPSRSVVRPNYADVRFRPKQMPRSGPPKKIRRSPVSNASSSSSSNHQQGNPQWTPLLPTLPQRETVLTGWPTTAPAVTLPGKQVLQRMPPPDATARRRD